MLEKAIKNKETRELFRTIARLRSETEVKKFLRDLCTLAELKALAARWQVAKEVKRGTPYRDICKKTGSSTATVTRVAHWLHHGMGGYKLVLDRLV